MTDSEKDECPLCKGAGIPSPKARWEWLGGTRGEDSWSARVIPTHWVDGEKHPRVERKWKDA